MRRLGLILFAAALAACGNTAIPQSTGPVPVATSSATDAAANAWFICDGTDAPTVLVFMGGPPAATTTMIAYDKSAHGSAAAPIEYTLGEGEGAAGSFYTPLQLNGRDAGHIRQINTGMLDPPSIAYTTPYTSVALGDREISCRWMPRTRLMGFSDRRTFVITEDADGDLIYDTYDFGRAARPIDTSEGGRTTTFSVEVRGGEEHDSPGGVQMSFANNGYRYVVTAETGNAQVQVFHGAQLVQTEQMLAVQFGTVAHGTTP